MDKGTLTLGSLFDGSGGFPLAGILAGIKPVFSSEIEPFPIRVTTKRLPGVQHYGDVSALSGHDLPPVDIITLGFPCQSVSTAGKREAVKHTARGDEKTTRSGLFYEAVRIIREMREATDGKYPRYIVIENVPGLFSSNKGEDFRSVLEEICRIRSDTVQIPGPERKWDKAGEIVGDGFSVAWRVLNAMYWSVPQRRARIFLVADLGGESAGEILFKSEGLSGYSAEGFRAWQASARRAQDGPGEAGCVCLNDQGGDRMAVSEDVTGTLRAQDHGHPPVIALEHHPTDGRIKIERGDAVQTLTGRMGTGGNNVPLIMSPAGPVAYTLKIRCGKEGGGKGALVQEDRSATLATNNDQTLFAPAFSASKASRFMDAGREVAAPLVATDHKDPPLVSRADYIVRRLTPTECARLQGFPDWWCRGLGTEDPTEEEIAFWTEIFEEHRRLVTHAKKPKTRSQIIKWLRDPYLDSSEYKLWGNGVALPCVWFVLAGIVYFDQM